jgi:hypothetical protein
VTTAAEYRNEIERIKAAIQEQGPLAVRQGHVSQEAFENFAAAVGATPEDAETRAAREELEAYVLRVQQATRSFLPRGKRDQALQMIGVAVPEGNVGRLRDNA